MRHKSQHIFLYYISTSHTSNRAAFHVEGAVESVGLIGVHRYLNEFVLISLFPNSYYYGDAYILVVIRTYYGGESRGMGIYGFLGTSWVLITMHPRNSTHRKVWCGGFGRDNGQSSTCDIYILYLGQMLSLFLTKN